MNELLSFCKVNGIKEVVCHARNNAVSFYLKLGFEIYDDPFTEVDIRHEHMRISLND
ncbi:GNAT family N-acetyltransferase [Flavobacterium sp. ACAM 123]|uniref:GNAT family N-acetyltransferase n=1 Tax=Flavobacterium sp. ACAM 123 TaxID=1189620 RepID=UPI001E4D4463|nr:GNAT family N-acetyltransferase [Flavobacterium sp. ACAM 123]